MEYYATGVVQTMRSRVKRSNIEATEIESNSLINRNLKNVLAEQIDKRKFNIRFHFGKESFGLRSPK